MHLGARHLVGHGRSDRPRARAEVDDDGSLELASLVDGPAGQQLGLRSRHEDAGPDRELDVSERRGAEQVLERFAGCPSYDQGVEGRGLV